MLKLVLKSVMELFESDLRLILVQNCFLTVVVIFFVAFFGGIFIANIDVFGFSILNSLASWISGLGLVIIGFFIFPSIILLIGSFFSEKICARVERRHYVARVGSRNAPVIELIWSAIKNFGLLLIINLILLPPSASA